MLCLKPETLALLEDIEARISPETEEDLSSQWHDFLYGKNNDTIFRPKRMKCSAPGTKLQRIPINEALNDPEAMLAAQFTEVSAVLNTPHLNPAIRANYGTGILSSLFGAEIFEMPAHLNTLPTTKAFNDTEVIRRLVDKGMPDLENGFGARVFACGKLYREVMEHYPKIAKYVSVYHPDLQGPLDICELLWGCDMFIAMYEEPELVHAMLSLLTDTYIAFMEKWFHLFPCDAEMNMHWAILRHRGRIALRDDSAMNLSPDLYREFAAPYDGRLLAHFGGGAVHFCGRGDHYIDTLCSMPYLYGVNMSQPHLNDMEKIYRNTVDKGIPLLAFPAARAEEDKNRSGGFHGWMHAV